MTVTAVIFLYDEEILIWAIPPLSPHADSSFASYNPTHLPPPLFTIKFPDGIVPQHISLDRFSQYCGSSGPLYYAQKARDASAPADLAQLQVSALPVVGSIKFCIVRSDY